MNFSDRISTDLNTALKGKNEVAVSTLRLILSNLKNAAIAKGSELTDEEAIGEIAKDAKRHKESIAVFEQAGRAELAEKEKAELEVISGYLPKQLSDEELAKMIDEAIAAVGATNINDVGRVVKAIMSSAGIRADGAKVAEIARKKLDTGRFPEVQPGE